MQEILVVMAIALAIFFLPRLMAKKSAPAPQTGSLGRSLVTSLTGWMRLAILITLLWCTGCAAYLKPWTGNTFLFFCISLGPTLVLWGGIWVWFGYKRYRR